MFQRYTHVEEKYSKTQQEEYPREIKIITISTSVRFGSAWPNSKQDRLVQPILVYFQQVYSQAKESRGSQVEKAGNITNKQQNNSIHKISGQVGLCCYRIVVRW